MRKGFWLRFILMWMWILVAIMFTLYRTGTFDDRTFNLETTHSSETTP